MLPLRDTARGHDAAFERELTAMIPRMRAFARSLTGDPARADDLAQDALTKAWRSRASFQLGTNMKAWTFRIVRNEHFSERRRSWRSTELDPEVAERSLLANDNPAAVLELEDLRRALDELPIEQREALVLVGAGGVSYDDAAEICHCAIGTVKSRVSRARKALAAILDRGVFPAGGSSAGEASAMIIAEVEHLQRNRGPS